MRRSSMLVICPLFGQFFTPNERYLTKVLNVIRVGQVKDNERKAGKDTVQSLLRIVLFAYVGGVTPVQLLSYHSSMS
jgi:hypothetical protein